MFLVMHIFDHHICLRTSFADLLEGDTGWRMTGAGRNLPQGLRSHSPLQDEMAEDGIFSGAFRWFRQAGIGRHICKWLTDRPRWPTVEAQQAVTLSTEMRHPNTMYVHNIQKTPPEIWEAIIWVVDTFMRNSIQKSYLHLIDDWLKILFKLGNIIITEWSLVQWLSHLYIIYTCEIYIYMCTYIYF